MYSLKKQNKTIVIIAMLLARFTCNFKCDKVRKIVAWGKNCREQSDRVFAIGYQVVKELVGF